jgi:NADPH2:quinone reductase
VKAVRIQRTGGPEVLEYVDLPTPEPGPGQVLVQADTIGVSVPEILVRTGKYGWMPPLPAVLGIEMAGRIAQVGKDVTRWKAGDPVFVSARELPVRGGCYAEYLCCDEAAPYPLPQGLDLELAASFSGYQVAWHLLHSATKGYEFDSVLVWAAAGGVGSAAVELARLAGMRVIGIASGPDKCGFVHDLGAQACIDRQRHDVGTRLGELTGGAGVDLVLDCVGGPQFGRNFGYLKPFGLVINYGLLAGPPDASFAPEMYKRFGDSVGLRYFSMHSFDQAPGRRRAAMDVLVPLLAAGKLRPRIAERIPLAQVRRAHELFESGAIAGKLVLKP